MKLLLKIFVFILILGNVLLSQELVWNHLDGPMGGTVADIIINSQNEIFAGVYGSIWGYYGIYKSTDNGDSWKKVITPFPHDFPVYALFLTKDEHIWVGTDHYGLYRSTDNGITWEKKDNGYLTNECWAFGESRDGVLFAGDGQYDKVFRSTNNGDNWEFSTNLRPYSFATDSNNKVFAGTATGLYLSTNNGITWVQNSYFQNIAVSSVLIDERNNLYCGTGYYGNGNGVFMSTDEGISWTQLGLAGKVVLSLEFDSQKNLYAGTLYDGIFKTTDMGQSWIQTQEGLYRQQILRIKINELDEIFVCGEGEPTWYSDGGVLRSTNGGINFKQIGLPISNIKNIVFSGDSLIIASTPSGVQKFNRETKEWKNLGLYKVEAVSITQNNILYAATRDEGLYKSSDLGNNWSLINLSPDTLLPLYNVMAINQDTLFVIPGLDGYIRRSFNGGENWTVLSIRAGGLSRSMYHIGDIVWVTGISTGSQRIYNSTDFGSTFNLLFSGFGTEDAINSLFVTNDMKIFIASQNNPQGIIRSSNNSLNWSQVLFNTRVAAAFANDNGMVITGSIELHLGETNQVYLSFDSGDTWINRTQPTAGGIYITDIKGDINGNLFFATSAEGLFEVDVVTSIDVPSFTQPQEYYLYQNYPNPFNPTTKISWQSPVENWQTLKVIDILGSEVAVLVDEYKPAGTYEVEFDASGLASGIYFYQLNTESFISTKKMLLVR